MDELRENLDSIDAAIEKPSADATAEKPRASDRRASSVAVESDRRTREGRKKSIQADIDADVARAATAKREADAETERLATLRTERARFEAPREQPRREQSEPASDDPEPTLESCGNDENKFLRDYGKWEMREAAREVLSKRDAASQQRESVRAVQQQTESALATFSSTLDTNVGKDKRTAFLQQVDPIAKQLVPYGSLAPGQRPTGLTAIADSVIASSIPEKLLLHFTANPMEFARIGGLHPVQALREVGILEGKLGAAAASVGPASRPLASAAKPPSKPIGGSPHVSHDGPPSDDASDEEYERYWAPRRKAALRG